MEHTRVAASDLHFEYDQEADILYCSFGLPVEATSVEVKEGILLRTEEHGTRIVGFALTDFTRQFTACDRAWTVPLRTEELLARSAEAA